MKLIFTVALIASLRATSSGCLAPLNAFGDPCEDDKTFVGKKGSIVMYLARPWEDKAHIECEFRGMRNSTETQCEWGWHRLSYNEGSLIWDSNSGKPAVRCKSLDIPTQFYWSFVTAEGHETCENTRSLLNKIMFKPDAILSNSRMETIIE